MERVKINIESLKPYVYESFSNDQECIYNFDPKHQVNTWNEVSDIVYDKICLEYSESNIFGIEKDDEKIGYFVYHDDLLISFAINSNFRNKNNLEEFWGIIKDEIGGTFRCILYSTNRRAIGWLNRYCGMDILFDSITILETSKN